MLDLVLSVLAVVAGGMVLELFAATRAPLGYQDEDGFHLGVPGRQAPDLSVLATATPKRVKARRRVQMQAQLEPVVSA